RLNCHVTALHIEHPEAEEEEKQRSREEFEAILATAPLPGRLRQVTVRADQVEPVILEHAASHAAVVMGAAAGQPGTPLLFGPIAETVAQKVERVVVVK